MWYDKKKAIKGKYRISENTLFIFAILCGALGIYVGMQAPLFHKKNKLKFNIGIPILMVVNLGCLVWLFYTTACF